MRDRLFSTIKCLLFLLPALLLPQGLSAGASAPRVFYAKAEGIVNPVMAKYLTGLMADAQKEKIEALVIQLDTPGGLDLSMRDIIKEILSSGVPVVVYVAPAGSRAASAGVFITYAASVAAMAPGTNIGSAHPVAMGGEKLDETMMKKVENDAVAYIKGIALKRKRNADWAEAAVRKSVNITAEEALKLNVIDLIAKSKDELIERLDGRTVELPSGPRAIRTKGAEVKDIEMNLRFRVLNAISNPNVAYILMMIGLAGLYFELSNPGVVLPGVVGAVSLVLAFYAFQTLSINYAGLLLIGLAVIFFMLEIKIVSYGLLTVAGAVALFLGSLMLFDSPLPFMRVSLWVMLPVVLLMTAAIASMIYYAAGMYKKKPISGMEGIVGVEGVVAEDMESPGEEGKVFIDGEYWNAVSEEPVRKGERIKVKGIKGLVLTIVKA